MAEQQSTLPFLPCRHQLTFSGPEWSKISPAAKGCVAKMLERDPSKRPSALELLQHPWVKENGVAGDNIIETEVSKRLREFASMNKFKREAFKVRLGCRACCCSGGG